MQVPLELLLFCLYQLILLLLHSNLHVDPWYLCWGDALVWDIMIQRFSLRVPDRCMRVVLLCLLSEPLTLTYGWNGIQVKGLFESFEIILLLLGVLLKWGNSWVLGLLKWLGVLFEGLNISTDGPLLKLRKLLSTLTPLLAIKVFVVLGILNLLLVRALLLLSVIALWLGIPRITRWTSGPRGGELRGLKDLRDLNRLSADLLSGLFWIFKSIILWGIMRSVTLFLL